MHEKQFKALIDGSLAVFRNEDINHVKVIKYLFRTGNFSEFILMRVLWGANIPCTLCAWIIRKQIQSIRLFWRAQIGNTNHWKTTWCSYKAQLQWNTKKENGKLKVKIKKKILWKGNNILIKSSFWKHVHEEVKSKNCTQL